MTGLLIALVVVAEIGAIAGLFWLIKRWQTHRRRRIRASDVETVESNLPRTWRERVTEIDAEPGSYRGPGRKGEPFFAPGGIAFLVSLAVMTAVGIWFNELFRPAGQWVGDWIRRALN